MSRLKSTPAQYGRAAASLHWSIAVLVLVALASGLAADNLGEAAHAPLRVHVIAGILAGLLTLARIAWWWFADTKPDTAPNNEGWKGTAAKVTHILLVLIPIGMATSGVGMMILSGAGQYLFGGVVGPLPDFEQFAPRTPHGIGAKVLIALVVLHTFAALYHHYMLKDGLMRRMWPFGKA